MRTVLLTGAALVFAASAAAQAADIYAPAPGYGAVPPPSAAYGAAPPPVEAVPGFVEAPPPPYAPLQPPLAYPQPPHVVYPHLGYGPAPGWVYGGPPVVAYGGEEVAEVLPPRVYRDCWWEWGRQRCVVRRSGW